MDNLPLIANLELTNACNIACKYCAHKNMKRLNAHMDKSMIDLCMKRIDEAGIKQVTLNTIGETLVAKELEYALVQAKRRQLLVLVSTNGMALDELMAEMLLNNGCDVIRFSANSIEKERYEILHLGAKFEKLIKNMKMLKEKRDIGHFNTNIRVRMVLSGEESDNKINEYKNFWLEYSDEVEFVSFGNMGGRNGASPILSNRRTHCKTMKRGLNINVDGNVTYCPCDFDAECIVGSIKTNSLEEIWNGEKFTKILNAHNLLDFSSLPRCEFCDATREEWYDSKKPVLSLKEEKIMDLYMENWRK